MNRFSDLDADQLADAAFLQENFGFGVAEAVYLGWNFWEKQYRKRSSVFKTK